ncbi:MAG: GIY-YIG nuclease family protein [Candidatus Moranbacteria bacterium]|nr:GIY-YIG nuclease family protein [Candidatus Moranbacteria bacterium]
MNKIVIPAIGVTSDLIKRIQQHKTKITDGFSKKYDVRKLVHYEQTENIHSAIAREKALKKWNRAWKINLIEQNNPNWDDLYFKLIA